LVVVDASAIVDALLGAEDVLHVLERDSIHAPVSVDAEVLHAIRRQWFAKLIKDLNALGAVESFRAMDITRHPVQPLVERMWALRRNITAYDAGYVALAESLHVPLLTRDWRLAHASGHAAAIEYIA